MELTRSTALCAHCPCTCCSILKWCVGLNCLICLYSLHVLHVSNIPGSAEARWSAPSPPLEEWVVRERLEIAAWHCRCLQHVRSTFGSVVQGLVSMSQLLGIYWTSPKINICWNIPNSWVMWNIGTFYQALVFNDASHHLLNHGFWMVFNMWGMGLMSTQWKLKFNTWYSNWYHQRRIT